MKKKIKITFLALLLILMSLFIVYFIKDSFAQYKEYKTGQVATSIAKPIVRVIGNSNINLEFLTPEKERYAFKVVNYDEENNLTEVGLGYEIELDTSNDCPINYSLYKIVDGNEEKLELINNIYSSDEVFSPLEAKEENYILEVWLDKDSNIEFQENTDIIVNLKATQVLPIAN